ncbi:hypothetical protein RHGRI_007753 [Rhododendron griersonianum]|uniref:Uncharacterized protein n=1 Tax=Rhododendron griersonianum TaxID=479676 RepID=A0AAV6KXV4_9ERIC|nr:hypothetical protein RHGRI_007753 [Rhododendron griersonianum]
MLEEGPFSVKVLAEESSSSSSSNPTNTVIFVGISLVLGIVSRHLLRGTRVPYTVALLILGIGLRSLVHFINQFPQLEKGDLLIKTHQLGLANQLHSISSVRWYGDGWSSDGRTQILHGSRAFKNQSQSRRWGPRRPW